MSDHSFIKDSDIFAEPHKEPSFYKVRPTVKGIVFDEDGKIALLSTRSHYLFPGGGVDDNESLEEACIRECKEEIGCDIEIDSYIGQFDQYRAVTAKNYEIHFFAAHVVGEKGDPTTDDEEELTAKTVWEFPENILNLLEEQLDTIPPEEYAAQFNARTHIRAFEKYIDTLTGFSGN